MRERARHRKRSLVRWTLGAVVASTLLPVGAEADSVTLKTNRSGTACEVDSFATVSGASPSRTVEYGVSISPCNTRFGVRSARADGFLYEFFPASRSVGKQVQATRFEPGDVPYNRSASFTEPMYTPPNMPPPGFRSRIDFSIVLKGRRNARTRRAERWVDPGRDCRIESGGSKIVCQLIDIV